MTARQIGGNYPTVTEVLRAAGEVNAAVEAYVEVPPRGAAGEVSSGLVAVGADGRRRLTFGGWDGLADRVAALFAAEGVGPGDVVCLLVPSSIDYALCYLAAARLGAVTTGVNLRLGPKEVTSIVSRVHPALTVIDSDAASADACAVVGGRMLERTQLGHGPDSPPPRPRLDAVDPVAIVWTSGSTGTPKGAVFDHRCLAAVAAGTDVLSQPGDRRLSPLPFAHVGYMTRPWDEIAHGVTTVITPQPWTAGDALSLMATERVTVGQGVPTQWALILRHPDFDAADLSALRIAGTGAARVPPELVREMRDRLGCPVVVRYTSTEASLGTGTLPSDAEDVVATTVGRPVPGVELVVVGDDGEALAPGEIGRVRLRSGAVLRGYVGDCSGGVAIDPSSTAAALDAEGWVTTGDLGSVGDDGNLRLAGRVTEMYIRGGYNVYPGEVEAALGAHPSLAEVAVVAAPDPVLGEIGVVFAVPADATASPSLAALRRWCSGRLTDYKVPDRLELVDELPLTPMGKVDKLALGSLALGRLAPDSTQRPTPTKVGR